MPTYNGSVYTEIFFGSATGDGSSPESGNPSNAWGRTGLTSGANWSALAGVDHKIGPGDALVLFGNYGAYNNYLLCSQGGAFGNPITIVNATGETPTIGTVTTQAFLTNAKSHIDIHGIATTGGSTAGIYVNSGSSYINLHNVYADGCAVPIYFSDASNCGLYNSSSKGVGQTSHAVRCKNSSVTIDAYHTVDAPGDVLLLEGNFNVNITALTVDKTSNSAVNCLPSTGATLRGEGWKIDNTGMSGGTVGEGLFVDGASTAIEVGVYIDGYSHDINYSNPVGLFDRGALIRNIGLRPDSFLKNINFTRTTNEEGIRFLNTTGGCEVSGASNDNYIYALSTQNAENIIVDGLYGKNNKLGGVLIGNGSVENVVRNSFITDNGGRTDIMSGGFGIKSDGTARDTSVINNVISGNYNGALYVGDTSTLSMYGCVLVNNHVAGWENGEVEIANTGEPAIIKNSIIHNDTSGDAYSGVLIKVRNGATIPDTDYNLYWSKNPTPFWVHNNINDYDKYTFEQWKYLTGKDAHSVFVEPKLINCANSNYHLHVDSPCLGTGTKIPGVNTDIEGNPLFPPYNIGPYGLEAGALGVAPVANDGPPRNNITSLTGTSTTIDPVGTYRLADTKAARDATGFLYGVDHWAFTSAGIPKEILGSVLIANGGGDQFFCGSKRIAGYSSVQVEPALTKIKRLTGV